MLIITIPLPRICSGYALHFPAVALAVHLHEAHELAALLIAHFEKRLVLGVYHRLNDLLAQLSSLFRQGYSLIPAVFRLLLEFDNLAVEEGLHSKVDGLLGIS